MAVSKEEFDKLKAGGSMTLSNLTSGKSDAALTAANAAKLAADATKAAADTAVQGNNLAKAYFDAKDISTSKIAAESSAIAAKTAAIDAEALAQAEKLVADAGTDAAKKTAAAAAVTAATAAVTAATAAVTAATTEKTAAATAFTSVAAIANANTAAKELIDDKLAADTDATSKAATLTAAQAAFDADASNDLSILNGTYDIKSTSDANGTYSIVLDLSHSNSALSGSANIEDFQMASNPNSATPVSLKSGLDISSVPRAQAALSRIKSSIDKLAQDRASLGAVQSRLNFTNEQLTVTKENLSAAISRIADVDVAEEATAYARYQILVQSGVSMLAQANKMPQSALQLLQG
jgi:flagellin